MKRRGEREMRGGGPHYRIQGTRRCHTKRSAVADRFDKVMECRVDVAMCPLHSQVCGWGAGTHSREGVQSAERLSVRETEFVCACL